MSDIGLDFETFGTQPLPKVGMVNYMEDPEFSILLACTYSIDGTRVFDFVMHREQAMEEFRTYISLMSTIRAHNAAFEMYALKVSGYSTSAEFIDTAVIAAAAGASRHLSGAAPQLLKEDKMEEGRELIQLFSIPNAVFDFKRPTREKILSDPELIRKWNLFKHYCLLDAKLSYLLGSEIHSIDPVESTYEQVTFNMNRQGWTVDLLSLALMQEQYAANLEELQEDFYSQYDPGRKLNLNSLAQLKEWCRVRGVRAHSFDKLRVSKMLKSLQKRMLTPNLSQAKLDDYRAVEALLLTKQELGGSALKKLDVIEAMTTPEGKLFDQYLHIGAPQTFRTTGRGVQMQNLPRLSNPKDMELLKTERWTNQELAANIRQLFTASHPDGELIVGDFSSVESRGLAWIANEEWKLKAFFDGLDLYKVLASKPALHNKPYDQITKAERQDGKVGDLSCGYGAGPGAVQSFAENMGIDLTEEMARRLVSGYRDENTRIVGFWKGLDEALQKVNREQFAAWESPGHPMGLYVSMFLKPSPPSLRAQHPGVYTLSVKIQFNKGELVHRVFHGFHKKGNQFCYYKPSDLKSGDLWKSSYTDPKTGLKRDYTLYGGKLAGILTQSLCRELFFSTLRKTDRFLQDWSENIRIVGQFHDEIVVDYVPSLEYPLEECVQNLKHIMSVALIGSVKLQNFPMNAEVNHAYRYIK